MFVGKDGPNACKHGQALFRNHRCYSRSHGVLKQFRTQGRDRMSIRDERKRDDQVPRRIVHEYGDASVRLETMLGKHMSD